MKAIEVVHAVSDTDKVNAMGWCVGGSILSSTPAVTRARGDESVASLTLLTTLLDFREAGDLGVFIDSQGVRQRELTFGKGGIYPGAELGFVFQALRANDLIGPNVVSNYLEGKQPEAFDLLHGNADATNLRGSMYAWYLRNRYLENKLREPGKLTMCGTPVDLRRIDIPSFVLAAQEDHIVPWRSAYCSSQLLGGRTQFVPGAGRHIADVIDTASKNMRSYGSDGRQGDEPRARLASVQEAPGSWWKLWSRWMAPHAAKKVPARKRLGDTKHGPIERAPGRYVKARAAKSAARGQRSRSYDMMYPLHEARCAWVSPLSGFAAASAMVYPHPSRRSASSRWRGASPLRSTWSTVSPRTTKSPSSESARCMSTVPVPAAISPMASAGEATPLTMTMMGGPIDARKRPTAVNDVALRKSHRWFESRPIHRVPMNHPGVGRRVCPGFLQFSGFVAMNPRRPHLGSHCDYFKDLVRGDAESAGPHRAFYDEDNAVLDMPAEYCLDTVETVFEDFALVNGAWDVAAERVRPQDIRRTALMTIDGQLDDVAGLGQTRAAHDLLAGIPEQRRFHHEVKGAGHYGIFSGRRWRESVYPEVRRFMAQFAEIR